MNIEYLEDFDSLNEIIFQYFQSQFYFLLPLNPLINKHRGIAKDV
jgi:hypothetical protein